jgi:hypothetical protein
VAILTAASFAVAPLGAQSAAVVGVVLDTSGTLGEDRLPGADVRLYRTDSLGNAIFASYPRLRADSTGAFEYRHLPAGVYLLEVRRIGYEPVDGRLTLTEGQVFQPRVVMSRVVAQLPGVVTTANRSWRARVIEQSGFLDRQRAGFGHFIDQREIDRLRPNSVYSLLAPYLQGCTMMYLNGMRARVPRELGVDEVVGIEIYRRNLQAPPQFWNPNPNCGSIVIWTANPADDSDTLDAAPR